MLAWHSEQLSAQCFSNAFVHQCVWIIDFTKFFIWSFLQHFYGSHCLFSFCIWEILSVEPMVITVLFWSTQCNMSPMCFCVAMALSLMGFLPSLHFPLFLSFSLPLFEAPPPLHRTHQWETLEVLTLSGGGQCQVRDLLLGYHQISSGKTEHWVALSFSACHVISFICWQLPERHRRLSSLSCHN